MPHALVVPAVTGTPTTFPTLGEQYRALADQLGAYLATSTSDRGVSAGEPGRWVIVNEFRDDDEERDRFLGGWLNVLTGAQAGNQRRLRRSGHEGYHGAVAVASVLRGSNDVPANLAENVAVEFTHPLPVRRVGMTKGLVDLVREAADRVYVETRLSFDGDGSRSYSLQNANWLTQGNVQIDGIWDWADGTSADTDPARRSPYRPEIVTNGSTVSLTTGRTYGSTQSFELKAFVQASRLVYTSSGGWAYSTAGPLNDSDQVAAPVAWILPVAMCLGLDYLLGLNAKDRAISDTERDRRDRDYNRRLETRWGPAMRDLFERVLPRRDADPPRRYARETAGSGRRWP